jgi:hypothetical protein
MITFKASASARLKQLRSLSLTERKSVLKHLKTGVPIPAWPIAMPCSACPYVVVLGVSPGNSPKPQDRGFNTFGQCCEDPTFGKAHPGFDYLDGRHYWQKVSNLCEFLVKRDAPGLSKRDALALAGHLNLGTGQFGSASEAAIQSKVVEWVSSLLYSKFNPKILVCFGLNGILSKRKWNRVWNKGGLQINWSSPDVSQSFDRYFFRLWFPKRHDGGKLAVVMWPNHPSRPPFSGGPKTSAWQRAERSIDKLLKQNGF